MAESGRLDEVARELYGVPPAEFVAARDEHVLQAKAAGDRALAAALRALRRPTLGAWLVNLLVRRRRALVDELIEVGTEFRSERLTRQRLHELSERRRELLHRLQADAQRLGDEAGVPLTADRAGEVEATLAAAVADPDAAEQVRSGRLATTLSYSGLGPELQLAPEATPPPTPPTPSPTDTPTPSPSLTDTGTPTPTGTEGEARHAALANAAGSGRPAPRAFDDARQRPPTDPAGRPPGHTDEPEQARRAAELAAATSRHDELRERRDELLERQDTLQAQLQGVRRNLAEVERALRNAERDVKARSF
jgi:hypothetical protein